jgi:hypothetical protein
MIQRGDDGFIPAMTGLSGIHTTSSLLISYADSEEIENVKKENP